MNTKLLVGSIVSVVILILVSFTSVIGYRSISSDVKVSPLFNIRSSKAIGKESKDIACDYVGKGEEITIPLPKREIRNVFIKKLLDIISKMDEKELNMFKKSLNSEINPLKNIENLNANNFKDIINKLKPNQKNVINTIIGRIDNNSLYTKAPETQDGCCTYDDCPFTRAPFPIGPFLCLFGWIYYVILGILVGIPVAIGIASLFFLFFLYTIPIGIHNFLVDFLTAFNLCWILPE